jgi:hypothetical protein
MAAHQRPEGGWFVNQAVNAVALLAYLGRGHVPGPGPYGDVIEGAKQALLSAPNKAGVIISKGKMYEHALATLALAELYGMDYDPEVGRTLRKAVDVIVRSQSKNGGWRYNPKPGDHDLSVSVMQIVALRAANNAEIPVPEETIRKALAYVRSCAHPKGGFAYQPGGGPKHTMSAAGILSLQLLGAYGDERIEPALRFLNRLHAKGKLSRKGTFFYYFHYYAIQAHYQAGGKHWNVWHPLVREMLLEMQKPDGRWEAPPGDKHEANEAVVGPHHIYPTAMACLILEIYNHYLPAYQR